MASQPQRSEKIDSDRISLTPRLLVVDDDPAILVLVKGYLKNSYRVSTTESPRAALRMLEEMPFDILLTDLMMDEMNGMDLIRSAKTICPSTIALVMTSFASKDAAVAALKEGAYDFLEKPLAPDMLRQAVSRAWGMLRASRENQLLLVELRQTNEELEKARDSFVKKLIAAQDDERRRIARELHDETGQSVTSILVGLTALADKASDEGLHEQCENLLSLARSLVGDVRRMSLGLHPGQLDQLGLEATVKQHVEDFARLHGLDAQVEMQGLEHDSRLAPAVEIALFRIIQEALTNIVKHAQADTASIVIAKDTAHVRLVVEDDGRGFDVGYRSVTERQGKSLGLVGIRERARLLGGTMTIESEPGQGTALYVEIPLEQ